MLLVYAYSICINFFYYFSYFLNLNKLFDLQFVLNNLFKFI